MTTKLTCFITQEFGNFPNVYYLYVRKLRGKMPTPIEWVSQL